MFVKKNSKRYPLSIFFLILFSLLSCEDQKSTFNEHQSKLPENPNVLFILVDDLGAHDLSFMGSDYYETPNIDTLASQGLVFTQGYSSSRVCSPSRASILTGKATARHGITDWIGAAYGEDWRSRNRHDKLLPADYEHQLPQEDTTLAEAFKEAGYATFFAGKWHLGGEGSLPTDHGFDINIGGWDKGSPIGGFFSPWKNPYLENEKKGENLSLRLADETAQFIEQNKDQPFLAYLSFYAVHAPIQTSEERWQKYRDKAEVMGIAEEGFEMEEVLPIRKHQDNPVYAGLVESVDDAVGLILNRLKELGLDKNTIVVFTSDNGGVASGDNYSTSNAPLRGGKGYQYEGGIREPFVIKVPNATAPDSVDLPVINTDFYPTLLDLAGIDLKPEQHQDGISLKNLFEGASIETHRSLFWHYPHYGNQGGKPSSIIRKGDWKLIYYYENQQVELYNLSKDVSEQFNVADQQKDLAKQLKDELLTWLDEVGANKPTIDSEYNADLRADYESGLRNKLMPSLELQRKAMLSEEYQPNKSWWDSKVVVD